MTRGTFFFNSTTQNVMEKLFPDSFLKNQNWAYLWINSFIQFVFIDCQVEDYQRLLKLSWRPLSFAHIKLFLNEQTKKTIKCLELVFLLPHFCMIFKETNISLLYSITRSNFTVWLPLFMRYWSICIL